MLRICCFYSKCQNVKKEFPKYWLQNLRLNKASNLNETNYIETALGDLKR